MTNCHTLGFIVKHILSQLVFSSKTLCIKDGAISNGRLTNRRIDKKMARQPHVFGKPWAQRAQINRIRHGIIHS